MEADPPFEPARPLESIAYEVRSRIPISTSGSLQSLCTIAQLHHNAAEPAHLAHQLGWPSNHTPNTDDLPLAAKRLGPGAKLSRGPIDRLNIAPWPSRTKAVWSCRPCAMASAC